MIWFAVCCVLPAALVSWLVTWLVRLWAPRCGLVDQPAARKVHQNPTPLGGGIGILAGVLLPLAGVQLLAWLLLRLPELPAWIPVEIQAHLSGVNYRSGQLWAILSAGVLLSAMGLLDDRFGLSWKGRLAVQFLVAVALVSGGVQATIFAQQPWIGQLFSIGWIVVLINALNFLDNMDGLSGGIGLIASALFAVVMLAGTSEPRWLVGGALLVLTGSIAGFLFHNWPPARIFMGDAGSTFIGMMLATLTVLGTFYDQNTQPHVIFAPLCVLAVPLYDFSSVMLIRLSTGKSPFQPDRNHFSHRLTDLGLSKRNAVLTVHLTTLTTGLGALLLYCVDNWAGAALILMMEGCLLGVVAILETAGRRKTRGERVEAATQQPTQPKSQQ